MVLPSNQILLCGDFVEMNQIWRGAICRLFNDVPPVFYLKGRFESKQVVIELLEGNGRRFDFERSTNLKQWSYWTNASTPGPVLRLLDDSPPGDHAFYRAVLK